jgi:ATP-binding cassette subfamily B protein
VAYLAFSRAGGRTDERKEQGMTTLDQTDKMPEVASIVVRQATADAPAKDGARRGSKLRPLLALAPYVLRYRARALLALGALIVAAVTTLVVPLAVRRMIDFGFGAQGVELINDYFSLMIAVVAVLALSSAARYYLVMTIGERIVADLRRDVFAHLTRLSPAFFDSARSGELISRLTADTTQIKSAVGASVSVALRNLIMFVGAVTMLVVTRPRLSGLVPLGQAAVARRAGQPGRRLGLRVRTGRWNAHRSGFH